MFLGFVILKSYRWISRSSNCPRHKLIRNITAVPDLDHADIVWLYICSGSSWVQNHKIRFMCFEICKKASLSSLARQRFWYIAYHICNSADSTWKWTMIALISVCCRCRVQLLRRQHFASCMDHLIILKLVYFIGAI